MKYGNLDKDTMNLIVYSDWSFATNKDYSSQVGYLIFMADKDNNVNTIDYESNKSRRFVRYVLKEETFGLAGSCDLAIVTQRHLKQMLGKC